MRTRRPGEGGQVSALVSFSSCSALSGVRGGGGKGKYASLLFLITALRGSAKSGFVLPWYLLTPSNDIRTFTRSNSH